MNHLRARVGPVVQLQSVPTSLNVTVIVTTTVVLVLMMNKAFYNVRKVVEIGDELLASPITKLNKYQRRPIRTFVNFFDSILPVDFKLSAAKLFRLKLSTEHDLSSLKTKYIKDQSTVTVKWFQLSCKLVTFLVLNSALNIHLYGDHGQCTSYTNSKTCGDNTLIPLITESVCQWNRSTNLCEYRANKDPSEWFLNTIILVMVMLVVQAILGRFMRFLITHAKIRLQQEGMCSCLWSGRNNFTDPNYNTFEGSAQNTNTINTLPVGFKHQRGRVVPFDAYLSEEQKEQVARIDYGERVKDGGRNATLQEYGLEEYGDELKRCQTRKATLIRGMCLAIMRQRLDYISPEREVVLMLSDKIHKWSWILLPARTLKDSEHDINYVNSWKYTFRAWYYSHYDLADPTRLLRMVAHGHLFNHELLVERLVRNRHRATLIRAAVMRISNEEEQDVYLIQQFLTQSMVGYRRKVLEALLFHPTDIATLRPDRLGMQYLGVLIVPLYILLGLFYVAFYGVRVSGGPSTSMWLTALVVVLIEDLLLLQPLKIFIRHVWIPRLARIDFIALHTILATRARTVLTRHTGLLRNINCVMQHYHPVCRVARLVPHLASARLLMSLTDYDLPVKQLLDRLRTPFVAGRIVRFDTRSPLVYDCIATFKNNFVTRYLIVKNAMDTAVDYSLGLLVYTLLCLPEWLQHVVVDCIGAIALNTLIIGLFLLGIRVSYVALIVVCIVLLLMMCYVVYLYYHSSVVESVETINTSLNSSPRGSVKRKKKSKKVKTAQMI